MKLFVDDTRDFPYEGYECCRDVKTATLLLSIMEFDFISLDYSLAGETGLDILEWMCENGIEVPHINIHSTNILGRERMRDYCEAFLPDTMLTMNMLPK